MGGAKVARLYDPIGFLGPLSILGRLQVQNAWESNFSWDSELPEAIAEKWRNIVSRIKAALVIPIPRWVGLESFEGASLHGFTDSSDRALGVVVYLVNQSSSEFLSSKPKVCPLKMAQFSVPR